MFQPKPNRDVPPQMPTTHMNDYTEIHDLDCKVRELPFDVQNRYMIKQLEQTFQMYRVFMESVNERLHHIERTLTDLTTPTSEFSLRLTDPDGETRRLAKEVLELKEAIVGRKNVSL